MNKKQKILGERFKNLRAELDTIDSTCTQDKLAQMLDLTKAQISEYETGRKTPSVRALMAYREKSNVPI